MDSSTSHSRKNAWLMALIIVWLLATSAALWWFQSQSVRPFIDTEDDVRFWQAQQVNALLQPLLTQLPSPNAQQVTLLYFWNPDCLCNQLSQRHLDDLLKRFSAEQLRVVAVTPANISQTLISEFKRLNGERIELMSAPSSLPLPSSPALALFDAEHQLGYFGAWGFGALCTVASDDFFPNIVRALQQDGYGPFANVAGSGCFCAWPHDASQPPSP